MAWERLLLNSSQSRNSTTRGAVHREIDFNYLEGKLSSGKGAQSPGHCCPHPRGRGTSNWVMREGGQVMSGNFGPPSGCWRSVVGCAQSQVVPRILQGLCSP